MASSLAINSLISLAFSAHVLWKFALVFPGTILFISQKIFIASQTAFFDFTTCLSSSM